MNTDAEMLQRYVSDHSEDAFADIITRHVNLVYSAALRSTNGDKHRAEDVAQQVFTELARKAKSLADHPALVGWLYTTSRRMELRALRTEQRRRAREKEALVMNEIVCEAGPHPISTARFCSVGKSFTPASFQTSKAIWKRIIG
jgi:RNA polymerase sigma factor (sigma-70 family)